MHTPDRKLPQTSFKWSSLAGGRAQQVMPRNPQPLRCCSSTSVLGAGACIGTFDYKNEQEPQFRNDAPAWSTSSGNHPDRRSRGLDNCEKDESNGTTEGKDRNLQG